MKDFLLGTAFVVSIVSIILIASNVLEKGYATCLQIGVYGVLGFLIGLLAPIIKGRKW